MVLALALAGPRITVSAMESGPPQRLPQQAGADFTYENATVKEDATWSGTVLVKGGVIVAPQATVRIEPGTVVRFAGSAPGGARPRMVIMGRLQAGGTPEKPVLFAPNTTGLAKGDWGGILFIATGKRNQLDHTRIEGAETAIEGYFSTLAGKGVTILSSWRGMTFRDSTVIMSNLTVSGCDTGVETSDSELEIRGATLAGNRVGIAAQHSSLALSSLQVKGSGHHGLAAEECRVKLTGCEFSENSIGALLQGGEGQLTMSRFAGNREAGLRLSGARVRFHRNVVADNAGDGLQVEGGYPAIWDNSFSGNGGNNLANRGSEDVSAVLNWWGGTDSGAIRAKLLDSARDSRYGRVVAAPWLTEKPFFLPERQ